uniref:F-box associated domain-containing protein n=1 Tax=Hordeum vulgare subsp. vulgare TaxID=112509 RepID=A0A8I6X6S1_HORVV
MPPSPGRRGTSLPWGCTSTAPPASTACYCDGGAAWARLKSKLAAMSLSWAPTSHRGTSGRWPDIASETFNLPIQLHGNLHWYAFYHLGKIKQLQGESKPIIVFDTAAESFRQMRTPIVFEMTSNSNVFEMDDTLGIYCNDHDKNTVSIWVLQNYQSEVWDLKYRIRLPVDEIRGHFEGCDYYRDVDSWDVGVVSGDGGVLLLVSFGQWVLHIDTDGKLIDSFNSGLLGLHIYGCRLKQSLVQHAFFPALEGYVVNASPFI